MVATERKAMRLGGFSLTPGRNQDIEFQSLHTYRKAKLRVKIRRNAYDAQSYARIEMFNPIAAQWSELWTLPHATMAVLQRKDNGHGTAIPVVSYTDRDPATSRDVLDCFLADEAMLLTFAKRILD
jgi:hypothetical protein